MKIIAFLAICVASVAGCSSHPNQPAITKQSQYEIDRKKTVEIENSMREKKIKSEHEFNINASNSGCLKHALDASRSYFKMAMKYYGTNPSVVSETPESWAKIATQACVSGYDAGVSKQPQFMLDSYLYSIRMELSNPFQYEAVAESMYWGYSRSMH